MHVPHLPTLTADRLDLTSRYDYQLKGVDLTTVSEVMREALEDAFTATRSDIAYLHRDIGSATANEAR